MDQFCTHMPISHEKPATLSQVYDNLTLLIEMIEGLFGTLNEALENTDAGSVAYLGRHVTVELRQRAEVLYGFVQTSRKEG